MQHHTFPDGSVPTAYGAYSHAVEAGGFVFVSGQIARDARTGVLIEGDVAAQTRRSLEIVEQILRELGLSLGQIVRATVYLADIAEFAAMNAVYYSVMPAPYPARSTPQVSLPFGARVSIEVTAYRGG
jgi:2-iminobutanoate/2-iminopropanoate deaminase